MGPVDSISELVTKMEIDSATDKEDAANSSDVVVADGSELDVWSLFKAIPPPVLETPLPLPTGHHQGRSDKQKRVAPSTRSSLRLAARPSPVPVSQRAQHKLMKELSFMGNQSVEPDAAVTTYIDMYQGDLPEQAVQAIRAATKLGNKKLAKVLEAMAEEAGAADAEGM